MSKRQFYMIQLTLLSICAFGLEFLIFNDYMAIFALLNPLILMVGIALIHPKDMSSQRVVPSPSDMTDQLVTHINHDINTPLTKIIGFCESALMSQNPPPGTYQKILDSALDLKSINTSYVKLMQLADRDAIIKAPFDLGESLRLVMIEFISELDAHHVQYAISIPEKPIYVQGNQRLIREALRHLIENSLAKYESSTKIMVKLKLHANHCQISIENHGHSTAFEFEQLAQSVFNFNTLSQNETYGRQGLTLKLTKAIVENHLGFIDYISEGSKSRAFQVTLPIYQQ